MGSKYTHEMAQQQLDLRNGNFIILEFNGMRAHSLIQCKNCGYSWLTAVYQLYDVNTPSKGCPQCSKQLRTVYPHNFLLIKKENEYIYECKKCGAVIKSKYVLPYNKNCQQCSKIDIKHRKLKKLLNEELQSYYILGFLIADGYFSKTKRLKFELQKRDKEIVEQIIEYLEIDKAVIYETKNSFGFCIQDVDTITKLQEKYGITNNKSIIPCNLNNIPDDKFLALLIGYVDGNGCIQKRTDNDNFYISIHCHASWFNNLNMFSERAYKMAGLIGYSHANYVRDQDKTYCTVHLGNKKVLDLLLRFIENNQLFVLNRKWNKLKNKGGGADE